jgi:hypothetical protein
VDAYFDEKDEAIIIVSGSSSLTHSYDDEGSLVREKHFDVLRNEIAEETSSSTYMCKNVFCLR